MSKFDKSLKSQTCYWIMNKRGVCCSSPAGGAINAAVRSSAVAVRTLWRMTAHPADAGENSPHTGNPTLGSTKQNLTLTLNYPFVFDSWKAFLLESPDFTRKSHSHLYSHSGYIFTQPDEKNWLNWARLPCFSRRSWRRQRDRVLFGEFRNASVHLGRGSGRRTGSTLHASRFNEDEVVSVSKDRLSAIPFKPRGRILLAPRRSRREHLTGSV